MPLVPQVANLLKKTDHRSVLLFPPERKYIRQNRTFVLQLTMVPNPIHPTLLPSLLAHPSGSSIWLKIALIDQAERSSATIHGRSRRRTPELAKPSHPSILPKKPMENNHWKNNQRNLLRSEPHIPVEIPFNIPLNDQLNSILTDNLSKKPCPIYTWVLTILCATLYNVTNGKESEQRTVNR